MISTSKNEEIDNANQENPWQEVKAIKNNVSLRNSSYKQKYSNPK